MDGKLIKNPLTIDADDLSDLKDMLDDLELDLKRCLRLIDIIKQMLQ